MYQTTEDYSVSPIAHPLADKKLNKLCVSLVRSAAKKKTFLAGNKMATKAVRKGEGGLLVIGSDVFPVDVISHIPLLCEAAKVPYVFVHGKAAIGAAIKSKRPTSCVFVKKLETDAKFHKKYKKVLKKLKLIA